MPKIYQCILFRIYFANFLSIFCGISVQGYFAGERELRKFAQILHQSLVAQTLNGHFIMVPILDGSYEIGAHVSSDLTYVICRRHLFRSKVVKHLLFF